MGKTPSTVGIAPGAGLVARFGTAVVYLAETDSAELVLDAVEAEADGEHPGAAIARRLAGVVFGGGTEPPAFGVVAPTEDGTVILLRGKVFAQIQGAEGPRSLSGARAFTWVDEIVREPVRRIRVGDDNGEPLPVHPATDLRAGIVTGSGFELRVGVRRTETSRDRGEATGSSASCSPPSNSPAGSGSPASSVPVTTASSAVVPATGPAAGSVTSLRTAASNGSAADSRATDSRAAGAPTSASAAKDSAAAGPGTPQPTAEVPGPADTTGSTSPAAPAPSSEIPASAVVTAPGSPAPALPVSDSATASATPGSPTPGAAATSCAAPADPPSTASRSAAGPTVTAAADVPASGSSTTAAKSAAQKSPDSRNPEATPEEGSAAKPDSAESSSGEAKAAQARDTATSVDSATPRALRVFGAATGAQGSAAPGASAATPMRHAPASDPSAWLTTPDSGDSAAPSVNSRTATGARTAAEIRGADTDAASNADTAGLGARAVVPSRSTPASNTGSRPIAASAVGGSQPTSGTGPTATDSRWSPASGSDTSAKEHVPGRSSSAGKSPATNSEDRPVTPATPSEPATAEPTGPRTADLPATAPAGFDALAADHGRSRDTARRPATPSPAAWSETEDPARPDFFASRPGAHQAPASAPGPDYIGSHPSGSDQWGRVVPLRPQTPPEPPGALVFEDVIYPLDRAYVVGRNPSGDETVRSGTAAPLTLPRDRHVSRVHAYVTLDNGVVYVRDAGTSGGTYIAAPGAEQWTRVGDTAVELAPGWRMRLGQKILTHRPPTRPLAAYPRRY